MLEQSEKKSLIFVKVDYHISNINIKYILFMSKSRFYSYTTKLIIILCGLCFQRSYMRNFRPTTPILSLKNIPLGLFDY